MVILPVKVSVNASGLGDVDSNWPETFPLN